MENVNVNTVPTNILSQFIDMYTFPEKVYQYLSIRLTEGTILFITSIPFMDVDAITAIEIVQDSKRQY